MKSSASEKKHRSKLLIWLLLILIMLSGLSYLAVKATALHAQHTLSPAPVSSSVPAPINPASSPNTVVQSLQQLKLFNPVIYKTQIIWNAGNGANDALWQSGQQQLTVVQGTVVIGADLSMLSSTDIVQTPTGINLQLPAVHVISAQVDSVTSYEVKTGKKSTVQMGLATGDAQLQAMTQQLAQQACVAGALQTTTESTQQQITQLLAFMHSSMTVHVADPQPCSVAPNALSSSVVVTSGSNPNELVNNGPVS